MIRKKNEAGFTLIELMIVIAIIGVLAAIAIPMFSSYRMKSYNSAALSDLKNLQTTQVALSADTGDYEALVLTTGDGTKKTIGNTEVSISNDNMMYSLVDTNKVSYVIVSKHIKGNITYAYDSDSTVIYMNDALYAAGVVLADPIKASTSGALEESLAGWKVK